MPCFNPVRSWEVGKTEEGKAVLSYKRPKIRREEEQIVLIPCSKCIGCLTRRSNDWATRCYHEARLHKVNSFITLTYREQNLPKDKNLNHTHFQEFISRLRAHGRRQNHIGKIRYFMSGEYGNIKNTFRPHYHALIFNYEFDDKIPVGRDNNGEQLYTSKTLEKLWSHGFVTIGDVNLKTAQYVAKYIYKKQENMNEYGTDFYENNNIVPEYIKMSNRPGIGRKWLEKWYTDVYPRDGVIIDGDTRTVPKYYDSILDKIDPELLTRVKDKRKKYHVPDVSDYDQFGKELKQKNDNSFRLAVREEKARLLRKNDGYWRS